MPVNVEEKAQSQALQRRGKRRHLWRVAGHCANTSAFDVASHDKLHAILSGLPMFPFIDIIAAPLSQNLSATRKERSTRQVFCSGHTGKNHCRRITNSLAHGFVMCCSHMIVTMEVSGAVCL